MNPVIIATVVKGLKSFFTNRTVLTVIAIIVIVLILKKKIKKGVRKYKEKQFDKNEFQDPNLLVQQYRSASNPSGINWLINTDGTEEAEILNLAYPTNGQKTAVSEAYQNKYAETLTDRLKSELSTKDFDHWKNIVS